ncbi:hypothetical protein ACIGO9_31270 [Nocardia asteroides]|uniref:hypothetical protein n=1 Tax=Nocardia asteroides TaxID=1824 RepID=UPI0037CA740E
MANPSDTTAITLSEHESGSIADRIGSVVSDVQTLGGLTDPGQLVDLLFRIAEDAKAAATLTDDALAARGDRAAEEIIDLAELYRLVDQAVERARRDDASAEAAKAAAAATTSPRRHPAPPVNSTAPDLTALALASLGHGTGSAPVRVRADVVEQRR